MAHTSINKNRVKKELEMMSRTPPAGISCSPVDDKLDVLSAQIIGQDGTPFDGGVFHLEIQLPDRYPFNPPRVRFVTPIYHPNIDSNGRICLDTLKLPPEGSWRPCLNISTVLMMIRILMSEPGADDPLVTSIWQEYKYNYAVYETKARQWTKKHATASCVVSGAQSQVKPSTTARAASASSKSSKTTPGQVNKTENEKSKSDSSSTAVSKSKKGYGLSTKRQTLEECNVNTKFSKT